MRICCALGLSATIFAVAGCGEDDGARCRALPVPLAASPLTVLPDGQLFRVGEGFVLVGTDEGRTSVRFARLAPSGEVVGETAAAVPPRGLGPWFGLAAKAEPGDQLLVVYGEAAAGGVGLFIKTLGLAGADGAPRALLDSDGQPVVVPADAQVAFRPVGGGGRSLLAWGAGASGLVPSLLLVEADGATRRAPAVLASTGKAWDCLALAPARTGAGGEANLGLSRVLREPGGKPTWVLAELGDDGVLTYSLTVDVATAEMGCPRFAPTPRGFTLAWQNRNGTYFADVDTTRGDVSVAWDIVRGAVRFGGPDRQPPVAAVAAMGKEFGMVYDTGAGPRVDRFTIFGNPRGGSLYLPSHGRGGPVSALAEVDAVSLTYLDRATAAGGVRYLARVECPAGL